VYKLDIFNLDYDKSNYGTDKKLYTAKETEKHHRKAFKNRHCELDF
jgi:hypothetical protein